MQEPVLVQEPVQEQEPVLEQELVQVQEQAQEGALVLARLLKALLMGLKAIPPLQASNRYRVQQLVRWWKYLHPQHYLHHPHHHRRRRQPVR